jgi:hypothetical protein
VVAASSSRGSASATRASATALTSPLVEGRRFHLPFPSGTGALAFGGGGSGVSSISGEGSVSGRSASGGGGSSSGSGSGSSVARRMSTMMIFDPIAAVQVGTDGGVHLSLGMVGGVCTEVGFLCVDRYTGTNEGRSTFVLPLTTYNTRTGRRRQQQHYRQQPRQQRRGGRPCGAPLLTGGHRAVDRPGPGRDSARHPRAGGTRLPGPAARDGLAVRGADGWMGGLAGWLVVWVGGWVGGWVVYRSIDGLVERPAKGVRPVA